LAVTQERLRGVPAELTCGQVILESDWLQKKIFTGVKRAARHRNWVLRETREVVNDLWMRRNAERVKRKNRLSDGRWEVWIDEEFADFPTLADALDDYAYLIATGVPYAKAWKKFQADQTDWESLAIQVGRIYATDPNYGKIVIQIANQANVQAAIAAARA